MARLPLKSPSPLRALSGGRDINPPPHRHISVLGRQAVEMLNPRDGGIYVDATFGAGGYSPAILHTPRNRRIGIHPHRSAISDGLDLGGPSDGRLTPGADPVSDMAEICAA